jgi:hypothetical protein
MSKFKAIFNQRENQSITAKQPKTKGKRSDPDYEQVSAYIRKDTYKNVKIALLQGEDSKNFSDLVEELLEQWLTSQERNS